jgi:hypothetical protein
MANLGRHRTVGYRVVFTIFLPSGDCYTRTLYRRDKRQAEDLLGLATRMEALLRQHALTADLAVTFQHEDLLRPEDLTRLFPTRRHLAFDRRALLASYTDLCPRQCISDRVIAINVGRAEWLLDTLGDLSAISQEAIEAWQNARLIQVAGKSAVDGYRVMPAHVQSADLCMRRSREAREVLAAGGSGTWPPQPRTAKATASAIGFTTPTGRVASMRSNAHASVTRPCSSARRRNSNPAPCRMR